MDAAEQHTLFARWLEDHAALLHHVVNGFAEGADRHDLMQELMLALWRGLPAFRGAARPSTFIYRVAYNTALTWKRGRSNYQRRVDAFEAQVPALPEAEAQRSARDREALALMYAEIRTQPPIERSLLLMHLDDVSYAEMAEVGWAKVDYVVQLARLDVQALVCPASEILALRENIPPAFQDIEIIELAN